MRPPMYTEELKYPAVLTDYSSKGLAKRERPHGFL
jgi:hypothetical protein